MYGRSLPVSAKFTMGGQLLFTLAYIPIDSWVQCRCRGRRELDDYHRARHVFFRLRLSY